MANENDSVAITSAKANVTEARGMYLTGDLSVDKYDEVIEKAKQVLTPAQIQNTIRKFDNIADVPEKAPKFKRGARNKTSIKDYLKPKFMKGGSYKGKQHSYAAGGMVKELKI